jgi:uncharacterized protein YukE
MHSLGWVSGPLVVDPELLVAAGAQADGLAADLVAALRHCEDTAAAAAPGWLGRSADALGLVTAVWAGHTTALAGGLHRIAEGLRVGGLTFAEMDLRHAAVLGGTHRRTGRP